MALLELWPHCKHVPNQPLVTLPFLNRHHQAVAHLREYRGNGRNFFTPLTLYDQVFSTRHHYISWYKQNMYSQFSCVERDMLRQVRQSLVTAPHFGAGALALRRAIRSWVATVLIWAQKLIFINLTWIINYRTWQQGPHMWHQHQAY